MKLIYNKNTKSFSDISILSTERSDYLIKYNELGSNVISRCIINDCSSHQEAFDRWVNKNPMHKLNEVISIKKISGAKYGDLWVNPYYHDEYKF